LAARGGLDGGDGTPWEIVSNCATNLSYPHSDMYRLRDTCAMEE
jgi:hypothetical protein